MKFRNAVALFIVIAAGSTILISCGSDSSDGSRLSGEVRDMVRYYLEMKQIGLAGKVDEFLAMRDSVTKDEVARYFERKGWVIDSAKVSNWAYNWPDIAGLPLAQDTSNGEWRRLVFKKCGMFDDAGKEQCIFPLILWHKDGDEWKVSNASIKAAYRYNEDGSELTFGPHSFHQLFRIPPDFRDFYPTPDSVKPVPQPIDPNDLPKGTKPRPRPQKGG